MITVVIGADGRAVAFTPQADGGTLVQIGAFVRERLTFVGPVTDVRVNVGVSAGNVSPPS